jgi:hypothetical protein
MIAQFLAGGLVFFFAVCPAAATRYYVADSIGTLSIEGFIETNDKIGVLSDSDIESWRLTITGHGEPITLDKGSSDISISGRALSATDKSIIFDHSEHPPYVEEFPGGQAYVTVSQSWLVIYDLERVGINWQSADPKKQDSEGLPGLRIVFFRPDFSVDIVEFVGRTGIKTIATVRPWVDPQRALRTGNIGVRQPRQMPRLWAAWDGHG